MFVCSFRNWWARRFSASQDFVSSVVDQSRDTGMNLHLPRVRHVVEGIHSIWERCLADVYVEPTSISALARTTGFGMTSCFSSCRQPAECHCDTTCGRHRVLRYRPRVPAARAGPNPISVPTRSRLFPALRKLPSVHELAKVNFRVFFCFDFVRAPGFVDEHGSASTRWQHLF